MSGIFDPRCRVPSFYQTDGNVVNECGRIGGYIMAAILSIFVIIGAIFAIVSVMKDPTDDMVPNKNKNSGKEKGVGVAVVLVITVILLVLIWIGIPKLSGFLATNAWQGYQLQIKSLMSQGLSRQEALNRIQTLQQTRIAADATLAGDANIASAIIGRGNNF